MDKNMLVSTLKKSGQVRIFGLFISLILTEEIVIHIQHIKLDLRTIIICQIMRMR